MSPTTMVRTPIRPPDRERCFLYAGTGVAKCRAHVADIEHCFARRTSPGVVRILFRLEAGEPLVVSFGIAMVDEGEPKFEGVDLCAGRLACKQLLERSGEGRGLLAAAVHVDTMAQREFNPRSRLK